MVGRNESWKADGDRENGADVPPARLILKGFGKIRSLSRTKPRSSAVLLLWNTTNARSRQGGSDAISDAIKLEIYCHWEKVSEND